MTATIDTSTASQTAGPDLHVQQFIVYPEGYTKDNDDLAVFYLDDFDLGVVTKRLEGRGFGGSEDGIVCVFINQDESNHEVRMTCELDLDRVTVLTTAIEQLTLVRDQLARLQAAL